MVAFFIGERDFFFESAYAMTNPWGAHTLLLKHNKSNRKVALACGERGIRTPGTSQYVGFQDRCNRPLCHLSNVTKYRLRVQRYV